jgi:formimidoylglutamate deiminase
VFSGARDLVRDVMVGGKWVVRESRHAREKEAADAFKKAVVGLLA